MNEDEQQGIFDDWMSSHKGLFLKVVRAYAFNRQDREDLFQEMAFQLWSSIPNFRREASATTWIYRVALYAGIAWSARERNYRERREPLDGDGDAANVLAEQEDPRVAWLYEQIARLDPIDRSLILLQLDGLSYREMSATLGISESNVGVKLNRIKQSLARRTASHPAGETNDEP